MKNLKSLLLTVAICGLFFCSACVNSASDKNADDQANVTDSVVEQTEFDLLVEYLEIQNFINKPVEQGGAPALITAQEVYDALNNDGNIHIIDLREPVHYLAGHIKGSENTSLKELLQYITDLDPNRYDKVVIVSHSGQTAAFATSVLCLLGYSNIYAMEWGLSSWNKKFAEDKWLANISDNFASKLEVTPNPQLPVGVYKPMLNTGKTTGQEILKHRAQLILEEGIESKFVTAESVFNTPTEAYVIAYWQKDVYDIGHIPGAVQYTPKESLSSKNQLLSLPDKKIITYCFTGINGAFLNAYLRILGYDAYTISYGANSFMNTVLKEKSLKAFSESQVKDFPINKSNLKEEKAKTKAKEVTAN